MALSRRNLIYLAVADVVLFLIANVLYSGGQVSRDISNVAWVAFLIGAVALIVLSVVALVQSRR
jgi:hypothetical protein